MRARVRFVVAQLSPQTGVAITRTLSAPLRKMPPRCSLGCSPSWRCRVAVPTASSPGGSSSMAISSLFKLMILSFLFQTTAGVRRHQLCPPPPLHTLPRHQLSTQPLTSSAPPPLFFCALLPRTNRPYNRQHSIAIRLTRVCRPGGRVGSIRLPF